MTRLSICSVVKMKVKKQIFASFLLINVAENKIQLTLKGEKLFKELENEENDALWRPEFTSYMLEGTPGAPYGETTDDLLEVERSMKTRRKQVEAKLEKNECLVSFSTFPRLGCKKFTFPEFFIDNPVTDNPVSHSEFFPDRVGLRIRNTNTLNC